MCVCILIYFLVDGNIFSKLDYLLVIVKVRKLNNIKEIKDILRERFKGQRYIKNLLVFKTVPVSLLRS